MTLHARLRSQSGATLLMVMGIAAALAVMTASLVLVVGNMQANTSDSRQREKAATAGEAVMDAQMYALAKAWPTVATPTATPTIDPASLRAQFAEDEFPNSTGNFVEAEYYDNSDTSGDGKVIAKDLHWDANGDRKMYIEAQANVNGRAARFQALVEREFVEAPFPHGIAVYDGGALDANAGNNNGGPGQGTNPKISVYNDNGWDVSGYVSGTLTPPEVFDLGNITVTSPNAPSLDQLIPDSTITQVIAAAKSMGRYYDVAGGTAQIPADMSGYCVIRVPDGTTVALTGGINMASGPNAVPAAADFPGVLLVLGPEPAAGEPITTNTGPHIKINMANNDRFYGVFYTDGQLDFAHGTPAFYGMAVFKSYMDMRGTCDIYYDDSAITKLMERETLSVKLVPNTWREIHPH